MELNILSGESSRSRLSFKVKGPKENQSGVLMKLHILSGGSSRSRSSFKVKGQKTKSREVISFKREILFKPAK